VENPGPMTLEALGDSAVVVSLGSGIDESALLRARSLAAAVWRIRAPAILDVVAAFSTVAVYYDPVRFAGYSGKPFENVCRFIQDCAAGGQFAKVDVPGRGQLLQPDPVPIEIPVCYGGDFGPDLAELAAHCGLTPEEVCRRHWGADYVVHAIGFVPGFPYLAGLPSGLAMPRRATPRVAVPAGSVGIGGAQTGVYPFVTPGGWQILGRTPVQLFSTERSPPSLLQAGDRVKFRAIPAEEFERQWGHAARIDLPVGRQSLPPDAFLEVIRPGLMTTVQDLGRTGYRSSGVPLSGAMDAKALRCANLLVGNAEGAAALEITLLGPEIEFLQDGLVAVEGGGFEGVKRGEARNVRAGERLKFGACNRGCRAYLAVAGGFDVAPVLGSRSTYLRGGFGGFEGRALKAGDRLRRGRVVPCTRAEGAGTLYNLTPSPAIRALRGAHAGEFGEPFFGVEFKVSQQSDRMGLRLSGSALQRTGGRELVSGAVVPGTVQIPPDGQPIVLAADAQTIGGYPQAAHVIAADLPLLGQLRPGDSVVFKEVTLTEAHAALLPPAVG